MTAKPAAPYTLAIPTADDDRLVNGDITRDRAHDREGGVAIWSTPISAYAEVNGIRVPTHGDTNWIDSTGEWTYGRFIIRSIAYNLPPDGSLPQQP